MNFSAGISRALAVLLSAQAMLASAHHSRAVYGDELTEISGELIEIHWFNPHPWLELSVPSGAGQSEIWRVEAYANVMAMERRGVSKEHFEPGEAVVIAGYINRRRDRDLLASNMLRADGSEILLGGRSEPYFASRAIGEADLNLDRRRGEENMRLAAGENRGIFRVWSQPAWAEARGQTRRHLPFTEAAIAARAEWDQLDNYILRCEKPGMPRIMLNPHPFEFVDQGSTILMLGEEFDIVRTIHMDDRFDPESEPRSRQGVSVGRWDGDTLVIETTRIDFPYFDSIGTPQSGAIRMMERYTLSDDQSRLDYEWVITDPGVLTQPAVVEGYWLALGAEILRYDCRPG